MQYQDSLIAVGAKTLTSQKKGQSSPAFKARGTPRFEMCCRAKGPGVGSVTLSPTCSPPLQHVASSWPGVFKANKKQKLPGDSWDSFRFAKPQWMAFEAQHWIILQTINHQNRKRPSLHSVHVQLHSSWISLPIGFPDHRKTASCKNVCSTTRLHGIRIYVYKCSCILFQTTIPHQMK